MSAKQQHTPGPLRVAGPSYENETTQGDYAVVDAGHTIIAETYGYVGPTDYRPAEANARLFAASPDLLEACEAIYRVAQDADLPGCVHLSIAERTALKNAIAKAKGE